MYEVAQMVEYYYKTAGIKPSPETCEELVQEEYNEWVDEVLKGKRYLEAELKELSDLVYVIYGYALSRGWNLDEAVFRVHSNNLARQRQDDGSILRDTSGKIVKNPATKKVDLSDLV